MITENIEDSYCSSEQEWSIEERGDGLVNLISSERIVATGLTKEQAFTAKTIHNAALAAERGAAFGRYLTELSAKYQKQLAAEREKLKRADVELDRLDRERSQLRQQLAAEREKAKIPRCDFMQHVEDHDQLLAAQATIAIINDALAKVKDGE